MGVPTDVCVPLKWVNNYQHLKYFLSLKLRIMQKGRGTTALGLSVW